MSQVDGKAGCRAYMMSCRDADESRELASTPQRAASAKPKSAAELAPAHYGEGAAAQAAVAKPASPPLSPAECEALPDTALEHQAHALRSRLARNVSYADRERDAAELVNVEAELQRRDAARRSSAESARAGVSICKRVADLPGNSVVGAQHWWINTTNKSVGMGQADGQVPGHGESGPPGLQTKLVDHSSEPTTACEVQRGVDEACVERELEVGKNTGTWIPGVNDCHTVVNDVIDKCRVDTLEKALEDDTARRMREADAGAP